MKRAIFAAVVLLAVILPVAVAEIAMRWMGLGNPILYYWNSSYRYAPVPNQRQERRNEATVTIDGHGLRAVEHWSAAADHHILFVGDSVTWGGTNTDDTDTFAARTCIKMEERHGGNFICGNAGVNAYGVDNMVARLRFDPAARSADTVVVTVLSVDTTRGLTDLHSSYFYSARPHGPLKALWELTGFLLFYGSEMLRYDRDAYDPRDDAAVIHESLARLYSVLGELRQKGTNVLLIFSPIKTELVEGKPTTEAVRTNIRESGIPSLDLTEAMASRQATEMYYDGVHLNRAGHELYATMIVDALEGAVITGQQQD